MGISVSFAKVELEISWLKLATTPPFKLHTRSAHDLII